MIHVQVDIDVPSPSSWMCNYNEVGVHQIYESTKSSCNPSELTSNATRGLPWRVELTTWEEVEIGGCKSERTSEKCKVQFSLGIMIVVICCSLVKACCMVIAVVRSREPTLVTLGDAVDSFWRYRTQPQWGYALPIESSLRESGGVGGGLDQGSGSKRG
ncbi:hypothetical protein B9Z19DRAFT_1127455 [Tuber borchii]|uniref:Uncharacterized protein n=1 Tax=Tuber borchii TaxID=42251 RepID=A0A2T6ZR54_TUBBO|nr:hypothetical protein B9Z19DRAFT_1127455 [Tuber borchii]